MHTRAYMNKSTVTLQERKKSINAKGIVRMLTESMEMLVGANGLSLDFDKWGGGRCRG